MIAILGAAAGGLVLPPDFRGRSQVAVPGLWPGPVKTIGHLRSWGVGDRVELNGKLYEIVSMRTDFQRYGDGAPIPIGHADLISVEVHEPIGIASAPLPLGAPHHIVEREHARLPWIGPLDAGAVPLPEMARSRSFWRPESDRVTAELHWALDAPEPPPMRDPFPISGALFRGGLYPSRGRR